MEKPRVELGRVILQGSPAARCFPLGAQPRFRARLSAASTQRFHQISLLSVLERWGRIELLVATLATSHSAIELRPHGGRRVELNALPQKDCVYSAVPAPAGLTCVSPRWKRARESNSAEPAYEAGRVTRPLPA